MGGVWSPGLEERERGRHSVRAATGHGREILFHPFSGSRSGVHCISIVSLYILTGRNLINHQVITRQPKLLSYLLLHTGQVSIMIVYCYSDAVQAVWQYVLMMIYNGCQ